MTQRLDTNEMQAADEYTPGPFEVELDLYRTVDLNMVRRANEQERDNG